MWYPVELQASIQVRKAEAGQYLAALLTPADGDFDFWSDHPHVALRTHLAADLHTPHFFIFLDAVV
jgi:hypothetical protein